MRGASAVLALLWLGAMTPDCKGADEDVRRYRVAKAPAPAVPAATASDAGSAATPPTLSASDKPSNVATPPPPKAPPLAWATPEGWTAGAGSSMRLASFVVPLPQGFEGAGDASIVRLGGAAGGLVANVNRWRGQVGLAAATEAEIKALARDGQAPIGPFRAFPIVNPETGQGMLAAVFDDAGATLFVKLTAPAGAVEQLTPAFLAFCASIRKSEAP
ncbi:MAG: hypothetical protein CSA66_02685 [Proteobacteria bacterium]|nr:MAG: hypothetical protein CSA66_02685 [Pseudomonadota bacterium]